MDSMARNMFEFIDENNRLFKGFIEPSNRSVSKIHNDYFIKHYFEDGALPEIISNQINSSTDKLEFITYPFLIKKSKSNFHRIDIKKCQLPFIETHTQFITTLFNLSHPQFSNLKDFEEILKVSNLSYNHLNILIENNIYLKDKQMQTKYNQDEISLINGFFEREGLNDLSSKNSDVLDDDRYVQIKISSIDRFIHDMSLCKNVTFCLSLIEIKTLINDEYLDKFDKNYILKSKPLVHEFVLVIKPVILKMEMSYFLPGSQFFNTFDNFMGFHYKTLQ